MSKRNYEYLVGYTAEWASTFRLDKQRRLLPQVYSTLADAIAARHSLENRERYQVYREMVPRGV